MLVTVSVTFTHEAIRHLYHNKKMGHERGIGCGFKVKKSKVFFKQNYISCIMYLVVLKGCHFYIFFKDNHKFLKPAIF